MRIFRLGLTFGLLLTVTACGSLNPPALTPTTTALSEAPSPSAPTATLPDPSGQVELILWLPPFLAPTEDNPAGLMLDERIQAFSQQRPDVEVQIRIKAEQGPAGLLETLQAASSAAPETLPDLIALDPSGLSTAALKGLVMPLSEVLDQPDENEWYPHAMQASQIDGVFYGAPFATDGLILAYRPNAFANPPLSWQQLLESNRTFIFPAGDQQALFTLAQYIQLGGNLTTDDGRPTIDASTLSTLLNLYAAATEEGIFTPDLIDYQNGQDTWQGLLNGRSQSAVAPLSQYLSNDTSAQVSAAPLPTQDGQGLGIGSSWSWAIVTSDPVRQVVVRDLIDWLSQPEFLGPWTEMLGMLPPTRSALELWSETDSTPIATLLASSMHARPTEEDLATLGPPIHQAVEAVLSGSLSPQSAALQANQQVQAP